MYERDQCSSYECTSTATTDCRIAYRSSLSAIHCAAFILNAQQVRLSIAAKRKRNNHKTPEISKTTLLNDTRTAKNLLYKLCALVQTRLLGIIAHRQQKIREQTTNKITTGTVEDPHQASRHPRSLPLKQPLRQHSTTPT